MNRNGKIALGCGGAGCLLIILAVIVVGILIYTGVILAPGIYSPNRNENYNYNRNSNFNSNSNLNTNSNDSSDSSSSSMSSDDKHKLYQAGASTQDATINRRVLAKLGFLKANGLPNDDYAPFIKEHIGWIFRNTDFIQSINTPEKAREYVDAHIDD